MTERISIDDSHFLKGLAIFGVLVIHTIAQLTPKTFFSPEYLPWIILADQLSRLSVPLFVAISGYGFAIKYQQKPLQFGEFVISRMVKLIPLYIMWSVFFWLMIPQIPSWHLPFTQIDYLGQLIFGGADYQMYFVPMILQLYALFLLTWQVIKKHASVWLFVAMALQIAFIYHFSSIIDLHPSEWKVLAETRQYLLFLSWIGYFLLGIWLAFPGHLRKARLISPWIWLSAFLSCLALAFFSAKNAMLHGTDALLALRFTRWEIILYASIGISFGISCVNWIKKRFNLSQSLFRELGKHSYLIFLSHTFLLRIIFSVYRNTMSVGWAVLMTVLTLGMCVASLFVQRQLDK